MKYIKFLNLLPLVMFILWDKLKRTLVTPEPFIIIIALAVLNVILCKNMKEYLISSIMLVVSTAAGIIALSYYSYYFVEANPETPIVGAFVMIVYGFFAVVIAGIGALIAAGRMKKSAATD